jgi:uncharacterized protein YggE
MKTHLLAASLFATVVLNMASAQQIQINKENKTIAINTSSEASAFADIAVVSVGFNTYGKDQDSTYADATRISNTIIDALTTATVPKDAIQSNNQSLSPIQPNSDEDKARYNQGLRFEFSQSWRITVAADQAAKVLHLAITAGANDSGSIDWKVRDEDSLQAEAASKTLEHARQIAERMAKGLGTKLGPLVYASNQSPASGIFGNRGFGNVMLNTETAMIGRQKINLKPLAISPERITKSATVYAVFAIE